MKTNNSSLERILNVMRYAGVFEPGKYMIDLSVAGAGVVEMVGHDSVVVEYKDLVSLHRLIATNQELFGPAVSAFNNIAEQTGRPLEISSDQLSLPFESELWASMQAVK